MQDRCLTFCRMAACRTTAESKPKAYSAITRLACQGTALVAFALMVVCCIPAVLSVSLLMPLADRLLRISESHDQNHYGV